MLLVPSSICYFLTDLVLRWVDVIETVLRSVTPSSYLFTTFLTLPSLVGSMISVGYNSI